MCEEAPIIGIDLGTTYSCVAVARGDQVEIIHGDNGNHTTASCVFFSENGERIVGDTAKEKSYKQPTNTIYGVKRFIGRSYEEYKQQESNMFYPYKITNIDDRPKVSVIINSQEKHFSAEEISAMVLEKLKERAEEFLNKKYVTKAVITVPAHFNDAQRQATKDAGKIAGLDVLRIVNEPTAAALAYDLNNKYKSKNCNILIYDFGGGTFDVSIVSIEDGVLDVKATKGDPYLGGDDIDRCLTVHFMQQFKKKHNTDMSEDKRAVRRLQQQCEIAKRNLSNCLTVSIELDLLYDQKDFISNITRVEFDQLNLKLFQKTIKCVDDILIDAKMQKEDIDEIVLVGGSTRIPRVRDMVKKYFINKEINAAMNPDEAVAVGAARQAGILDNNPSERIKSILLYDICSLSLGIEVKGGIMNTIIPRNTKIPTSRTKVYQTSHDNQTEVNIPIYEGERDLTIGNHKLGEFILTGLKRAPRGKIQFEVTFEVDSEGMLTVTAIEGDGKNKKNIQVKSIKNHLSEDELTKMIKTADDFRDEDNKRRQVIEAKIALQNCCYDLKNNVEENFNETDKKDIIERLDNVLDWLSRNGDLSKEDYVNKKEEVENTIGAIVKTK